MKIPLALVVAGFALLLYSGTLQPYSDMRRFNAEYGAMKSGDSAEFHALRDELLTPKYRLYDYGITLIFVAGLLALLRRRTLRSPGSALGFTALALAAPSATCLGFVFDVSQGLERGEFPHWADSMGIPLMSVPPLFVVGVVWAGFQLVLLPRSALSPTPLLSHRPWRHNKWLVALSLITVLLIVFFTGLGQYWYALPGLVWLFFYLSIANARYAAQHRIARDVYEPASPPHGRA